MILGWYILLGGCSFMYIFLANKRFFFKNPCVWNQWRSVLVTSSGIPLMRWIFDYQTMLFCFLYLGCFRKISDMRPLHIYMNAYIFVNKFLHCTMALRPDIWAYGNMCSEGHSAKVNALVKRYRHESLDGRTIKKKTFSGQPFWTT